MGGKCDTQVTAHEGIAREKGQDSAVKQTWSILSRVHWYFVFICLLFMLGLKNIPLGLNKNDQEFT